MSQPEAMPVDAAIPILDADVQQFNVVLSYGTAAENPQEAIATALAAIDTRSGAYVEVFADGEKETIYEDDLALVKLPEEGQSAPKSAEELALLLRAAFDLLQQGGGMALGLAMSGSNHPDPDAALMAFQAKVQEITPALREGLLPFNTTASKYA